MKFLAIVAALLASSVSSSPVLDERDLIPGAQIVPLDDPAGLQGIGACHPKHPDRRTVTIRPSADDTDDISDDFLWAIKKANKGGRLLLKKGETYIIGKKLDLSFLDDVEVQLDGELKVRHLSIYWG